MRMETDTGGTDGTDRTPMDVYAERIAAAVPDATDGRTPPPFDRWPESMRETYRRFAAVALDAMRGQPDRAGMVEAGAKALYEADWDLLERRLRADGWEPSPVEPWERAHDLDRAVYRRMAGAVV